MTKAQETHKYIRNEYGHLVPNPQYHHSENTESAIDRYWNEMKKRKEQRRDWEDRGEPVGF